MTILDKLVSDIEVRQASLRADRNLHTHYLKDVDAKDLISISYPFILRGLEKQSTLVQIAIGIGKRVRQILKLEKDPVAEVQVGWFICISYIECKILSYVLRHNYKKGKISKYLTYFFTIKDWNAIKELWDLVDQTKINIYPAKSKPANWSGAYHETGVSIIKKGHSEALKQFEEVEDKQLLFDVLNKLQSVGWSINEDVLKSYQYFLRKETSPSPFKLHSEIDPERKNSLLIEAEAIERLALGNLDNTFYHLYTFDFRGRIYPNTAFLHEQGSDNAKGLLLFSEGVPLGNRGLFYLKVYAANCFGNDKITLEQRATFVDEHLDLFISYAEKPTINQGWVEADSPFCFLAACNELRKIKEWILDDGLVEDYICRLPIYIDGSQNGVQHLTALSRDTEVAPLVNLTTQEVPGDLYSYIATAVWEELEDLANQLTQEEKEKFWPTITKAKELQAAYENAPEKSEQKALAYRAAQEWRNQNRYLRERLFPLFWLEIKDKRDHRKICKRGVMTIPYGATQYGMGQQLIEDTRDMSEYLRDKEHLHAAMLGNLLHKTCYKMLPGPSGMLTLFENLAEKANERDQYLKWRSPMTNFPVVQGYRKPTSLRTKLKYGDEELKVNIENWQETTVNKEAQKLGASPNIVHSFDAAHLTLTVYNADYQVTVVHDSFGTLPGNMADMFLLVREQFVRFYQNDPLENLLSQLDAIDLLPERGNLDIKGVLYSDYAFC